MAVAFLLIIIFPFIFYFIQLKNLNTKINVIKKAIDKKEDTFIDPMNGRLCSTKTGEPVKRTYIYLIDPSVKECIVGDQVLRGMNSGRIYKNYSYEEYKAHIAKQIEKEECWCGERKCFRDHGYCRDYHIKYHINDKYFYFLESEIKWTPRGKGKFGEGNEGKIYCYKIIVNPITKAKIGKTEISYKEYKKLGGEIIITKNIIEHLQ